MYNFNTLTKQLVCQYKKDNCIDVLIGKYRDVSSLVFILKNLGQLPKNFNGYFLIKLTEHENYSVRLWAVKNIAKFCNVQYLSLLEKIVIYDVDTSVKREAVSAIGRMKCNEIKEVLLRTLVHEDPKIICQAIRGLLFFKGNELVDKQLMLLVEHDNEMVRSIILKEYFLKPTKSSIFPHIKSPDYLKNVVVNCDTLEAMSLICDESIHLTFTSPPYYNARDYSMYSSYIAYLDFLTEVFQEVYRITKEGRFLIVNTSPIIIPRVSRAHSSKRYPIPFDLHARLSGLGWEFIDDIVWMKPEYSVKNRIGGFQQHRKPLAYKPNSVTEYLMVYRKQTDRLIDWNIKQYPLDLVNESKVADGFETNNVWQINPKSHKVHSAVFPVELCQRVINYYSFKGDLVFDPFAGSGTLGRTAKMLNRYFFLTEKNNEYFEYMKSLKADNLMENMLETQFLGLNDFKQRVR